MQDLTFLNQYSPTGFDTQYLPIQRVFYSPVDDVHGVLKAMLSLAKVSLVVAMYGFDDEELANIVHDKIASPGCFVQLSLDASQAGGVHEKALLAKCDYPETSMAVGHSEKGAIQHMKAFIVDGAYVGDGSTNWSTAGETKQDNQLTVTADMLYAVRARTRIDTIHDNMLMQMAKKRNESS